ncbi:MAG TPA: quinone oxidoreductase [Alphaproteobacteria bacterium]|jgi:NADPH2:quinone reductase|nr:quinone oxidoreductase [Alphaproteobacteria bacterium]
MAKAKAILVRKTGGPEVMEYIDVDVPEPAAGQVLIRHAAVGLNFIDVYYRTGLYPAQPPFVLGVEGAGVVEKLGEGVTDLNVGDRVAYTGQLGAYSERRVVPAERLVKIPKDVDDKTAAGMMLKGLTAHYLLHKTYRVGPGDTILVHAAAGGVGLILCQWAKFLGATVIGTVGSDAKAKLAKEHGCDHPIVYTREDFVARVKEITGGNGVPVVYDSVGKDTFEKSLDCLRPLGLMVSFGNSSGAVPPISLLILSQKGSLFVTRPTLAHYVARRDDLDEAAQELFKAVRTGVVQIQVGKTYPLKDAAKAHTDLESRRTTGSTVLLP